MTVRSKLKRILGVEIWKIYQYYFHGFENYGKEKIMVVCPFHSDTMPSMMVDFERGFAYCFSCLKSWDALEFVKQKEGVGVRKALIKLAQIINLEVSQAEISEMCERMVGKKYTLSTEETDKVQEEKLIKLALNIISWEFSHKIIGKVPGWRKFNHYIEDVYEELDALLGQPMTTKNLDKIKDLSRRKREWLLELIPRLNRDYEKLKREGQQERTGEFLGIPEEDLGCDGNPV